MYHYLFSGIVFAFAAAVQPGPLQTYYISQSIAHGWRRTMPAVIAPMISDIPIVILVIVVLKNVPMTFIHYLQCAGGLFLFSLAFGAWRTWRAFDVEKMQKQSGQQTLFKAVGINLLNPHPYLGWSLIMGPLFITGWNESAMNGIALLAGFYCTMFFCSGCIIFIFASARNFGARVSRGLIGISVLALACFGAYQLYSGIAELR